MSAARVRPADGHAVWVSIRPELHGPDVPPLTDEIGLTIEDAIAIVTDDRLDTLPPDHR